MRPGAPSRSHSARGKPRQPATEPSPSCRNTSVGPTRSGAMRSTSSRSVPTSTNSIVMPAAVAGANGPPRACAAARLEERLDAGLRAAEDQRVDVVRAFVGVDHLEVQHVARDAVLVADAVAAEHVAREPCDFERLAARVALHDAGDLDGRRAFVLHAAEPQAAL